MQKAKVDRKKASSEKALVCNMWQNLYIYAILVEFRTGAQCGNNLYLLVV
jgi:hypothetical protein